LRGDDRRPIGEVPARFTSARDIRSRQVTVIMQRLQKHALVHFSRNNKNDAHQTISGPAGESHERYEPIRSLGAAATASASTAAIKLWDRRKPNRATS
jgi:predicted transcriptional regulator